MSSSAAPCVRSPPFRDAGRSRDRQEASNRLARLSRCPLPACVSHIVRVLVRVRVRASGTALSRGFRQARQRALCVCSPCTYIRGFVCRASTGSFRDRTEQDSDAIRSPRWTFAMIVNRVGSLTKVSFPVGEHPRSLLFGKERSEGRETESETVSEGIAASFLRFRKLPRLVSRALGVFMRDDLGRINTDHPRIPASINGLAGLRFYLVAFKRQKQRDISANWSTADSERRCSARNARLSRPVNRSTHYHKCPRRARPTRKSVSQIARVGLCHLSRPGPLALLRDARSPRFHGAERSDRSSRAALLRRDAYGASWRRFRVRS